MAFILNDRVKETSSTTGTGTFTLGGAVSGFETFSAGIGGSNTTYYCIFETGTNKFEVGFGTLNSGASTLARTSPCWIRMITCFRTYFNSNYLWR